MIPKTMKAVVLSEPTAAEQVVLSEVPVPQVRPGWVLVKVKAFGLNHSEQLLRLREIQADYISKPIIPGIECVGEVADASDSRFLAGQKVAALMGGMGRSFNGSYAQYALLPESHVFSIETNLSWPEMAAVPETYFTAWGSLLEGLKLCEEDILLVRGGTCSRLCSDPPGQSHGLPGDCHHPQRKQAAVIERSGPGGSRYRKTGRLLFRRHESSGACGARYPPGYPALREEERHCLLHRYSRRRIYLK